MASRYMDHLKDIALGMLVAWRHIPSHLKDTWHALREFASAVCWLVFLILAPLLIPLSTLLAAYAAFDEARMSKRRAKFRAQVIQSRIHNRNQ